MFIQNVYSGGQFCDSDEIVFEFIEDTSECSREYGIDVPSYDSDVTNFNVYPSQIPQEIKVFSDIQRHSTKHYTFSFQESSNEMFKVMARLNDGKVFSQEYKLNTDNYINNLIPKAKK